MPRKSLWNDIKKKYKIFSEKKFNEIKRNFNKHIDESLTGYEVQATIPNEVNITENRLFKAKLR